MHRIKSVLYLWSVEQTIVSFFSTTNSVIKIKMPELSSISVVSLTQSNEMSNISSHASLPSDLDREGPRVVMSVLH